MAFLCRAENCEGEEDCPNDVRQTPFRGTCVSGYHLSYVWGWIYSKYWPSSWEATEGTKAGLDAGEVPPIPDPWGWSAMYLQLFGDGSGQGVGGWKALAGDGVISSCAVALPPFWAQSTAQILLCVVPEDTLRTRWRKQTFFLSHWASPVQTSV